MPETDPCEICDAQAEAERGGGDWIKFKCPRCQSYILSGTASAIVHTINAKQRPIISGWIYEQNSAGSIPNISSETLKSLTRMSPPSLAERCDKLLLAVVRSQPEYGTRFNINETWMIAASYSPTKEQAHYVAKVLKERGHLELLAINGNAEITPSGYVAAEEMLRQNAGASQGFVAMWFSEDLREAYASGFSLAILNAGYNPVRVDGVEHIGKIDDQIIAQIRRSRFVVADFTGQRGGVYFEAGFAHGLNLPVFYTCRKDDLSNLHFDIRQYNAIDWETPSELAERLANRISAVIGDGPQKLVT